MGADELQEWVSEAAERHQIPGVAVGMYHEGREAYAFQGVTSTENPLPVDAGTYFQFGSTAKTYTATAIMRLVEAGTVKLEERVRTYVPELKLKDEGVARDVTVMHLLNHTAGWAGDMHEDTGWGDDALARYVERMSEIDQVTPLGEAVSYNNAALSLAGRVIEKVTGKTYEAALQELVLEPLGMDQTLFFPNEIMTHRFAAGHVRHPDGALKVARPWLPPRGGTPAGHISSNAGDQIKWARFHLGDGTAQDGKRVLSEENLKRMQAPTVEAPGSAIGDAVGISWLLRDVDGVRLVGHGGSMVGQLSEFIMVPEGGFAFATLTNVSPDGALFNDEFAKWALETYAGVIDRDPEPVTLGDDALAVYAGRFETIAALVDISVEEGHLVLNAELKPDMKEKLEKQGEEIPEQPPIPLGLLPGEGDRYIVTDGPAKGMKGYFVRGASGEVEGIHVGGRLATRVPIGATSG